MDVTKSERFEQLDRLLTEHDGMLQTAQVIASGIVKPIFYEYVKEKNLQQVAHGIYVSEDTWIDAMFLLHLRCGQAVFSHESALFFHDLTDREPSPYAITVRRGYSTTRLKAEGLSVYTIKPELNMSKRKIFSRLLTEFMSPRTPGLMRCFCYICDVVRQYFPMNQRYFSMT